MSRKSSLEKKRSTLQNPLSTWTYGPPMRSTRHTNTLHVRFLTCRSQTRPARRRPAPRVWTADVPQSSTDPSHRWPVWSTGPHPSSCRMRSSSVVDRSRLANDRHFDLPWVLQALLDLLRDVSRQSRSGQIVDRIGRNQDPDLATGLDGKALFDPVEGIGYALERFQTLDVGLHHLAPGTRSGTGDSIGRRHDERLDGLRFLFAVMGGDGMHDLGGATEALGDVGANKGVRSLHLMVNGLTNVMQQTGGLGHVDIGAKLGGERGGNHRGFQ